MPANLYHVWKTSLLCLGLLCGMLGGAYLAHAEDIKIENPLGDKNQTIIQLIESVTAKLVPFIIVLATFSIIVVGFQFVVAAVRGDAAGLKSARTNLLWVVVGTAIVVGATVIAGAVKIFLQSL